MAAGHLLESGVVWVFHLDNPRFPPVDTVDGAHLPTSTPVGYEMWTLVPRRGSSAPSPPPFVWGLSWGRGWPLWPGGALGGGGCLFVFWGGVAPSDESSNWKSHLEDFLSPVMVTGGFGGWWFGLGGGGVPLSPLPHPPLPNHPPPSLPIPIYPNVAHSLALYLSAPTHTSEQTLPGSQSLNPLKMANSKGRSAARRRWKCPRGTLCAWLRSRHETRTGRASPALTTTSTSYRETGSKTIHFSYNSSNFSRLILTLKFEFSASILKIEY